MSSSDSLRTVLFLQGPASVFWSELAAAFEAQGARVLRVRLSAADLLFWRRPGAISYRGSLADWPAFLEGLIEREGIGDILVYADRPPYHAAASEVAARRGIGCHIVENGYLRPDWITLERGGMGVFSHFPDDPKRIREIARDAPEPDLEVRYRHSFGVLAVNEVVYDLANRFGKPLFPQFVSDRYYDPLFDFLSWIPRMLKMPRLKRAAKAVEAWDPGVRFWLLAMQLQSDYQIRANSHYGHLSEMFEEVLTSFAAHALPEDRLVVKLHPHDNGCEHWDRVVGGIAAARGIADRVEVIIGGDLGQLLGRSCGVVLVNSTVGIHTMRALKPLKVLGGAVYDLPGLCHRGPLDDFWQTPERPDPSLVDAFVNALGTTIQIKGDFYDPAGRAAAIAVIVDRVLDHRVNEPGGYVETRPRLDRFRAEGADRAARGRVASGAA